MAELPAQSVNMCVTDPPYGMGFQSNWSKSGPRHKPIEGDSAVDPRWVPFAFDKLRDGGCLLSFCDWRTSDVWRQSIESAGFRIVSQVIWDRKVHGMGDLTGAFAPMHDIIWYAVKGRRKFINGRPKSILSFQRPSPSQDNGHPTCKPVPLMRSLIEAVADATGGGRAGPLHGVWFHGRCVRRVRRPFHWY